jgi:hypothetical protein
MTVKQKNTKAKLPDFDPAGLLIITQDVYTIAQSTLREVWTRKYSGALKQDLQYLPSDCFDNFPFPEGLWQTSNLTLSELDAANTVAP